MAQLLLANPRKRRARRATAKKAAPARRRRRSVLATTTTKVTRRRYKRNPSPRGIMGQVQGAAVGAAGALAVDVAMAKLPIPANLRTGVMGSAMQGVVSIGLGMIVGKFANKKLGTQIADGGLTVALHGAMKSAVGPSVGLAGYDDNGLLGWGDSGLLGYQSLTDDLGFLNPAPVTEMGGFQTWNSDDEFDD